MTTDNTAPEQSQIIPDVGTHENPQVGRLPDAPDEPVKAEEPKPLSTRQALEKAMDEADAKAKAAEKDGEEAKADPKADEKAKDEASKAEKPRGEGGKFAKAEPAEADKSEAAKPATGQDGAERRQSEGKHSEPPARFTPDARDKWGPTPFVVKAEVHRIAQEYEAEAEKARGSLERYEKLRAMDEQLKGHGIELSDRINHLNAIGLQIQRNPVIGLEMLLRDIGPRKPDGSPVSLHDVAQQIARMTPQQYAQNMAHLGQQAQQPAQARQQQGDPKVAQLEKELAAMKTEIAVQRLNPMIESFAASRPDYHALQDKMAVVLRPDPQSGKSTIEQLYGTGLSPEQKLELAYSMVGGRAAPSHPDPVAPPANSQSAPVDPDGQKSIRGAPTAGQTGKPERRFKTNREALEYAFANPGRT